MQNVKTAISLQKSLFEQAENLARRMKISCSRLFVLALFHIGTMEMSKLQKGIAWMYVCHGFSKACA